MPFRPRSPAFAIPSPALPSEGIFANIYRKLAETSKQILSLHISSGLSETFNTARMGGEQVKEAEVTVVDTMTLSGGERFQVLAAAWAARAGPGIVGAAVLPMNLVEDLM
ncbi:MAG: DegV family protein [Anaerolineales bacterium]|nr:DegV family protein [Anaerolineales bacterium]